jgi:phosphoribosyl-AMP cyclohydrolase
MKHNYFQTLEQFSDSTQLELAEVVDQLAFNEQGLIPVITQDADGKNVLMLAWMNKAALLITL